MNLDTQRETLLKLASVWVAIDGLYSALLWVRRFSPHDLVFAPTIFGVA